MKATVALLLAVASLVNPARAQADLKLSSNKVSPRDVSATIHLVSGSETVRPSRQASEDVINVKDYGAVGDNVTDDTAAINNAVTALRSKIAGVAAAYELVFPGGTYRTTAPLNFTGLRSKATIIEMEGATIDPQFNGGIAFDALFSRYITIDGLHILTSGTWAPSIGLAVGRIGTEVSDVLTLRNPFVEGNYATCAIYNRESETDTWIHPRAWVTEGTTGIPYCADGTNHFNVQSSFRTITSPVDKNSSFNENTYITPDFRSLIGTPFAWLSGTARHTFTGGYGLSSGGTSCGLVLYFTKGQPSLNDLLSWDVHEEVSRRLTDQVCIAGTLTDPIIFGMNLRDSSIFASNSVFKVTGAATSVALFSTDIDIGQFSGTISKVFDNPALWTVSGQYHLPSGATQWNLPIASFNGIGYIGSTTSFFGSGASLSLRSPAPISIIKTSGAVGAASPVGRSCFRIAGGGGPGNFQSVILSAPPPGGRQAAAAIVSLQSACPTPGKNIATAGSGYTNGDVVTVSGGTFLSALKYRLTVSGGEVTAITAQSSGLGYTFLPAEPVSVTGGAGKGLTLQNIGWSAQAIAVTNSGDGYAAGPGGIYAANSTAVLSHGVGHLGTVATKLSNTFAAWGSGFQSILLNTRGALLGSSGPSGVPAISLGALIDGSGVRSNMTGTAYGVPSNTSLVRLTQASAIQTQTIILPIALNDGQPIQFVNYAGPLRSLTFSPAVLGWTNGSTLAAYTGLRVRWDSAAAAWVREQ